ncbi:MAG: helix-turn-helix domain-containing protein [Cellulomonadaceae bacterium]|nr:helix-turn-helix domain-containing protein [Cellulomonadaceae bacterium]
MHVITEARRAAGLSQADLARRLGMPRQNLTAIEAGRRPASQAMIARVLDATGRPSAALRHHRDAAIAIIARLGGTNPRVFGSVARGEDIPGSDIDLLVDYVPGRAWEFITIADELEELLGCEVDVISAGGLRSSDAHILRDARPLRPSRTSIVCTDQSSRNPSLISMNTSDSRRI